MRLFKIKISDGYEAELIITDEEMLETVIAKADKAMLNGKTITWHDGRTEWIEDEIIFDPTKDGSYAFTWDASGNRVKYERVRYTKIGDEVTKETLRTVFKGWA